MLTIVAFLVALGLLIAVHEYGHYRVAVACGVKVLRFSVGFGKPLLRWQPQGSPTEFVLGAFPLGGYVRMLDEREGPVAPADRHRAFNRKPVSQRAFIVAAGPLANLALAVVLYAGVNWAGVQELSPWMAQPQEGSMAESAGLQAGHQVLAARPVNNGAEPGEWNTVRSMSDLQWQITQAALAGLEVQGGVQAATQSDVDSAIVELGKAVPGMKLEVELTHTLSRAFISDRVDGALLTLDPEFLGRLTPDGLLFVIAHEYAHVHLEHQKKLGLKAMELAGMPTPQFIASMTEFRDGRRPSTLMGHVAAVLDDMQLGVVQAREQAQPDSERHHPIVATPHQQGRHSYERRPLTSTVTKRPVYASESRGCAGSDPRRTGPSLLTDHWLVGCSRP